MKKLTKEQIEKLCTMTKKQQKAFNRLRQAYWACEDAGIFFYNLYSALYGFNDRKINSVENEELFREDTNKHTNAFLNHNIPASCKPIQIEGEWSDDPHILFFSHNKIRRINESKASRAQRQSITDD